MIVRHWAARESHFEGVTAFIVTRESVMQLLAKSDRVGGDGTSHGGVRLLVCAPQNFTCDVFCRRLLEAGVDPGSILRMIDPRWPANRVVRPPNTLAPSVL